MMNKSDDELLKDVQAILNKAPVEFEQIEDGIDELSDETSR